MTSRRADRRRLQQHQQLTTNRLLPAWERRGSGARFFKLYDTGYNVHGMFYKWGVDLIDSLQQGRGSFLRPEFGTRFLEN